MVTERTLVRNFYRALIASAYVAGATAVGGPPAGAVAIANLASPLGVATVELGADQATRAALDSTKMAMGGLVTQPTFAMIGEAGPEMVVPLGGMSMLPKKKRSRKAKASDKKLSKAFKMANSKLRLKNGQLKKGKTQADVARMAQKLRKKM